MTTEVPTTLVPVSYIRKHIINADDSALLRAMKKGTFPSPVTWFGMRRLWDPADLALYRAGKCSGWVFNETVAAIGRARSRPARSALEDVA